MENKNNEYGYNGSSSSTHTDSFLEQEKRMEQSSVNNYYDVQPTNERQGSHSDLNSTEAEQSRYTSKSSQPGAYGFEMRQERESQSDTYNNSSYYDSARIGQAGMGSQHTENNHFQANQNQQPHIKIEKKKPRKNGFGIKMAKCAALALTFGLVGGGVFYGMGTAINNYSDEPTTQQQESIPVNTNESSKDIKPVTISGNTTVTNNVSQVVKKAMPSIVSITNLVKVPYNDFFSGEQVAEQPSAGSGIIVGKTDEVLYIATNNHVVAGDGSSITVNFIDDKQVAAEIKGTDPSTDLAVLSVPIKDIDKTTLDAIQVATLGNSDNLQVGEGAIAIGNALGYGQSVTTGIVSALDREVTVVDENTGQGTTNNLVQTDAAINPGNSGGALLNLNGEVIGINSVKYMEAGVEGMGYAIPIARAEPIINDLITREKVSESETAFLGISGLDMTKDIAAQYQIPEGVYIMKVTPGSAAETAGLLEGDVIVKFDGRKIGTQNELSERLTYYAAGTEVELTIMTLGDNKEYSEKTIKVTLGKRNP
jgi:serine protease Do